MSRPLEPALAIEHLTVSYPARRSLGRASRFIAVDDLSLRVEPGQTLALVGESGSGKSTVARAVVRLLTPDAGSIRVDGTEISGLRGAALRRVRPLVQMVFQDPRSSLDPEQTIGRSIGEPLDVHMSIDRDERDARVAELLTRVGLSHVDAHRYPDELSGGQRQRVAIARALAVHPKVLICDEAVSALDVSTRNQIINLLEDVQAETGVAYLFIAHDLSIVRHLAQDVAVMKSGRVVDTGPTERVFEQPGDPYTEELLAAIPMPKPSFV